MKACSGADEGPWRQSEVLKGPRVQLKFGLNRTNQRPTSVLTKRPQSSTVSCAVGRWYAGGELN
jgi:hypothetical protein